MGNGHVWEVDQPVNIEAKQKGVRNALGTIPAHITLVPINFITQDFGEVPNEHAIGVQRLWRPYPWPPKPE